MAEGLKIVGKRVPRIDAYKKVTGKAKYTGDLWQYGMLYCKVLRSPYAHARILRIDTSKADKLTGVKAVLTYKDVPHILFGEDGADDAYVLTDKARFFGDEVAAVAAETEEIAEKALELIGVEYEELPIALTPDEALKPEAALIPPPEVSKSNLLENPVRTTSRDWGNVDEGFKEAEHIFEKEASVPIVQHMPVEPKAWLAKWDEDKLTVWASTQRPFAIRTTVCRVLKMPETKVRIISPYVGGGFGSKNDHARCVLICALLAQKTGRPVRLIMTKEEDMLSRTRPAVDFQIKIGVKKDGTLTAMNEKMTIYGGAYNYCLSSGCSTTAPRALFRCPNYRFDVYSVYTNHPSTGQMRGVLNTVTSFMLLQMIEQIAEKLGFKNPMELIKKIHVRAGDECDTIMDVRGTRLSSTGLDQCIEQGAKAIGWGEQWRGWNAPVKINGTKRIGLGMTVLVHDSALPWMVSGAVLKVNADGTANFFTPVTEIGGGEITTQTQVVSEASGIPMENIEVTFADTDLTPLDPMGQVCSSTAHIRSMASKRAGEDARRQLLEQGALQLGVKSEELEIEQGKIYVKADSSNHITIKELMEHTEFGCIQPIVGRGVAIVEHYPQRAFSYGAHFALVEVDTETGEVKVIKYVAAHDVGKALNPAVCEAQIHGGVVHGLGQTFTEGLVYDQSGKPRNLNYTDYKILTAADCPEIIPIIVETDDPLGAWGAKGFGEAPVVGTPACIANAIYNAIGQRFSSLPITPEKVLEALK
jgi:xanthine dehydrogenase molybdenum-binding subunit